MSYTFILLLGGHVMSEKDLGNTNTSHWLAAWLVRAWTFPFPRTQQSRSSETPNQSTMVP